MAIFIKIMLALMAAAFAAVSLGVAVMQYRKLFALFPTFYFFSRFPIPGIGSPEKLYTFIIIIIFLAFALLKPQNGKIDKGLIGVFILLILSFVPSIFTSPVGWIPSTIGVFSHFSMGFLIYVMVKNIRNWGQINGCIFGISILVLMFIISAIFLMVQFKSILVLRDIYTLEDGNYLVSSFFRFTVLKNPTFFARNLLICFPFLFIGFMYPKSKGTRYYYMGLILASIFVTLATLSKLAFAVLILNFFMLYRIFGKRRKRFFIQLFLLLLFSSLIFAAPLLSRFEKMSWQYEKQGNLTRVVLWISAYSSIAEHPIFGSGAGRQAVLYQMLQHGGIDWREYRKTGEKNPREPHNTYLFIAMEGGVIALLCLFVFFGYYIKLCLARLRRMRSQYFEYPRDIVLCGVVSVITTGIMGLTSIAIWMNILWFLIGLSIVAISIFDNQYSLFSQNTPSRL
jgi:O-antigen ligase